MAQIKDASVETCGQEKLYAVACIECGKRIFRFSEKLFELSDGVEVKLICPDCHVTTCVSGNGVISMG